MHGSIASVPGLCSFLFGANQKILLDKLYNRSSDSTVEMWTPSGVTGETFISEKRIIILISGATSGAAEEFISILKRLGRATVIGHTTSGGSLTAMSFRIDGTDLYLSVPVVRSDASQGRSWEGVGVDPHIPVSAENALDKAKEILNQHLIGME
ncbi:hypothetical protein JZ751_019844 [Albula glossodonta]|uniref:Tail specific protease domain-containing protein n=1 Tax=Albula glossodonta TaxID=121402 RepID=A0A8T2NPG5_9TELE|nr:hypothetical protein JZ751_019844 [Albula glossodonta]